MQTTKHPPLINIQGLHVSFGKNEALHGIDLEIPENRITALIGPAKSGKSVLLQALNRMNELETGCRTQGKILLRGDDIMRMEATSLRQRVGMVFQQPAAFHMSVYNNVAFGPRLYGNYSRAGLDELVESALRTTGLWDELRGKLKRNASELNASQQQRLCIARVLAGEPEVLLLDECTADLDTGESMRIEELIKHIAASCTVVIATHNIHHALHLAHICAFMADGEIVEQGPADDLFANPRDTRTELYISGQMA